MIAVYNLYIFYEFLLTLIQYLHQFVGRQLHGATGGDDGRFGDAATGGIVAGCSTVVLFSTAKLQRIPQLAVTQIAGKISLFAETDKSNSGGRCRRFCVGLQKFCSSE